MPAPILGANAALLEPAVVVADVDAAVAVAVPGDDDEEEELLCCSEECAALVALVREEEVLELIATLVLVVSVGLPAEV